MNTTRNGRGTWILAAGLLAIPVHASLGQSPGFTYQGRLTQAGEPVDGMVDLTFSLYAQETGGSPLGTQPFIEWPIDGGLFSVVLNESGEFGPDALNGDARWLEVSVNGQPLTPRQLLTAAPVAVHAMSAPAGSSLAAPDGAPSNALSVDDIGRVGIGTSSPQEALHVNGNIRVANDADLFGLDQLIGFNDLRLNGDSSGGPDVVINAAGYVGIGTTTTPNRPLTIQGSGASAQWLQFRDQNGADRWHLNAANGGLNFAESGVGDYRLFLAPDGKVGIGTSAPVNRLTVAGDANVDGEVGINIADPGTALHVRREPNNAFGTLALEGTTHTFMSFFPDGVSGGRKAWFGFSSAEDNDVKIANTTPGANIVLQTAGSGATRVNVLEVVGGSDVAEPYVINAAGDVQPQPGMVVSIDAGRLGSMRVSNSAYDRSVAGIISGANGIRPGMILRQEGTVADGTLPVATFGRVWCWVDADAGGPVAPGDLLTTAPTPGHAMKAVDHDRANGALIGKAMSGLSSGRGLVFVLVSLQ